MSNFLKVFLDSIHEKKIVKVVFKAYQDNSIRERFCIPFDYAPSRMDTIKVNKYQFYDLNSPYGKHNLALVEEQIQEVIKTENPFDPKDFIMWKFIPNSWKIARDWGEFS